jgi:hypothetical protein
MSASEKIAKLETQYSRGLITMSDFLSQGLKVLEIEVAPKPQVGEIWVAYKDGKAQAFQARYSSFNDEIRLWILTGTPSHCDMGYWRDKGYTGFKRVLSAI